MFEIGNVYSKKDKTQKIYYMAISHRTLVTYKNSRFGQFTTKKEGYITETNMTVAELCEIWGINTKILDNYMGNHFQPDNEAKLRARKDKEVEEFVFSDS